MKPCGRRTCTEVKVRHGPPAIPNFNTMRFATRPFLNGAVLAADESNRQPSLEKWLDSRQIQPLVVAEFDDSALMYVFGQEEAGIFPVVVGQNWIL